MTFAGSKSETVRGGSCPAPARACRLAPSRCLAAATIRYQLRILLQELPHDSTISYLLSPCHLGKSPGRMQRSKGCRIGIVAHDDSGN